MKKIILVCAALTSIVACNKKDIDPVTGFNSTINMQNIQFYNLVSADSLIGSVDFKFIVTSDTSAVPDTIRFTKKYAISSLISDQKIYFNTPAKTKTSSFVLKYNIYGGRADSVHINNFDYQLDNKILISKPKYFQNSDIIFTAPEEIYNF